VVDGSLVGVTELAVCCVCPFAVCTDRDCVDTSFALGIASVALVQSGVVWLCTEFASDVA
jgi:hypothetical protein